MTAASRLQADLKRARWRSVRDAIGLGSPWAGVLAAAAWRWQGVPAALATLAFASAALAAWAWRRATKLDDAWLARQLNAQRGDMEDSADLLFANPASMNALQRLQLARLRHRVETGLPFDPQPPKPRRGVAIASIALAVVAIASFLLWPLEQQGPGISTPSSRTAASPPSTPRLIAQRLRIVPPAYTRQPQRDDAALDAKAPQGSRLQWRLRFDPQPRSVALWLHDGRKLALTRDGGEWRGEHGLDRSVLYRIVLDTTPPSSAQPWHRLEAVPDRPPQVRVIEPERSLSFVDPRRRTWRLVFEASDDYGVAASATLRITLAQGSGENIVFRERTLTLSGSGSVVSRRYAHDLNPGDTGMAIGDDLVAQLTVADNRSPQAQTARSPSLILRWPSQPDAESSGLEGVVQKVLPAYFRSQRQIIIDAEALLAQRRKLTDAAFLKRSDEIGVDQRILRLRYGQFLGEEAEGAPPLPTNDAESPPVNGSPAADAAHGGSAQAEAGHEEAAHDHEHGEGHAHADAAPSHGNSGFGREDDVLEAFGHTHDHAEAATLLDPETRATLKLALSEMWQSELNLRQGHPNLALPYAYRALKFIKQVQQASRIYLARVGQELPPIDESRRLSGERKDLTRRGDALDAATAPDATLDALWRSLEAVPGTSANDEPLDRGELDRWLRNNEGHVSDPLALVVAVEAVRADPRCVACRQRLRALLWPLLTRPPAQVRRRDEADAAGRRYLDALRGRER